MQSVQQFLNDSKQHQEARNIALQQKQPINQLNLNVNYQINPQKIPLLKFLPENINTLTKNLPIEQVVQQYCPQVADLIPIKDTIKDFKFSKQQTLMLITELRIDDRVNLMLHNIDIISTSKQVYLLAKNEVILQQFYGEELLMTISVDLTITVFLPSVSRMYTMQTRQQPIQVDKVKIHINNLQDLILNLHNYNQYAQCGYMQLEHIFQLQMKIALISSQFKFYYLDFSNKQFVDLFDGVQDAVLSYKTTLLVFLSNVQLYEIIHVNQIQHQRSFCDLPDNQKISHYLFSNGYNDSYIISDKNILFYFNVANQLVNKQIPLTEVAQVISIRITDSDQGIVEITFINQLNQQEIKKIKIK